MEGLRSLSSWLESYSAHTREFFTAYTPGQRQWRSIERSPGAAPEVVTRSCADTTKASFDALSHAQTTMPGPLPAIRGNAELESALLDDIPRDSTGEETLAWTRVSNACLRTAADIAQQLFNRTPAVCTDRENADAVVANMLSPQRHLRILFPLVGFSLSNSSRNSLEIDQHFSLRTITDLNREGWLNEPFPEFGPHAALTAQGILALDTCIQLDYDLDIRRRTEGDYLAGMLEHRCQLLLGLINCLYGAQDPIAITFHSSAYDPPAASSWGQQPLRWLGFWVRNAAEPSDEELTALPTLWGNVPERSSPIHVALEQCALTPYLNSRIQSLLHYVIALEALFVVHGENKYRLALRVAAWTGTTAEERQHVYKAIKLAYDTRSDYVHGRAVTDSKVMASAIATANVVSTTIVKALGDLSTFHPSTLEEGLLSHS